MAGKPRVSPGEARKAVRDVLAAQEGDPISEAQLFTKINYLVGGGLDLSQLREAMEWNLAEAYIRSEYIKEADMTSWFITRAGINHDRIK